MGRLQVGLLFMAGTILSQASYLCDASFSTSWREPLNGNAVAVYALLLSILTYFER
jgi:hypothetical protein